MKHEYKRLNDVYNTVFETLGFGFFQSLYAWFGLHTGTEETPEWLEANSALLDAEYHGNISGKKPIAPLVENMLDENGHLTLANAEYIASMFWALFGLNLQKQYNLLFAEYNPLENYNMTESGTDTDDTTTTTTKNGKKTDTHKGQTKEQNSEKVYGFDSSSPVDSNYTETTTTIGLDSVPVTDETTYTDLEDETVIDGEKGHSLTRSGNIGVTTSQQMLESERNLWIWNFYHNYLFPCVDRILTLPIY